MSHPAASPPPSQAGAAFPTQIFPALKMKTRTLPRVTRAEMHAAPREEHPGEAAEGPADRSRATGAAVLRHGDPGTSICPGVSNGCRGRCPDPTVTGSTGNPHQSGVRGARERPQRTRSGGSAVLIRVGRTRTQSTGTD